MAKEEIAGGTVHEMPADLRKALTAASAARAAWQSLTPLARNEWNLLDGDSQTTKDKGRTC